MIKDNVLIDKTGSTIKYSSEGPDIDDLELEEEDVVVSPVNKIKRLLKEIESKSEEQVPSLIQTKEVNKEICQRRVKLFLKFGSPRKEYKLYGNLKKFHYVNKNSHYYFWITMSVKTTSLMRFVENSLNTQISCNQICISTSPEEKPFIFNSQKNSRNKKQFNWDVTEIIVGTTRGDNTQIKMKIY